MEFRINGDPDRYFIVCFTQIDRSAGSKIYNIHVNLYCTFSGKGNGSFDLRISRPPKNQQKLLERLEEMVKFLLEAVTSGSGTDFAGRTLQSYMDSLKELLGHDAIVVVYRDPRVTGPGPEQQHLQARLSYDKWFKENTASG
jgi:hypothetical protein